MISAAQLTELHARLDRIEAFMGGHVTAFEREALRTSTALASVWRAAELASWHTGVPLELVLGVARDATTCRVRDAVYHVARHRLQLSLPAIGARLNRDHTTVIAGLKRAAMRVETDPAFRLLLQRIGEGLDADERRQASEQVLSS